MAKPGSNDARRVAGGGVDLSAVALSDEQAARRQEAIEVGLGVRCAGCLRRIEVGLRFTSIDPRAREPVIQLSACIRDDCDFAEKARDGATFVEPIEFAWLDPAGAGARSAQTPPIPSG